MVAGIRHLFTGVILIALFVSSMVPALASGERFYDKGRAESTRLEIGETGKSTFVLSAAATYYRAQGWGRERIRVWGRNEWLRERYPEPYYRVSGVAWANLRFYVDCGQEPRCGDLSISVTDPGASSTERYLDAIFYDILGYKGISTSIIQAIINGLYAKTTVEVPHWYDATVKMNAGFLSAFPEEQSSLPSGVHYSQADGAEQGASSGIGAKFEFRLPSTHTNFTVWPQGMVAYLLWQRTCSVESGCVWSPFRVATGATGVHHTVNTQ